MMAITVGEVLKLAPLQEIILIAGRAGLGRVIECVDVLEVPDVADWLRQGEFVVTTCYAVKDDLEAQLNILKVMKKVKGAAVAVKFGRFLGNVPLPMKELADELRIPLLAIPDHLSFMDITLPVMTAIINEQSLQLKYSEEVRQRMIQVMLGASSLEPVSKTLSELIVHDVAICDEEMQYIAMSGKTFFKERVWIDSDIRCLQSTGSLNNEIAAFPIKVRKRCYGYILVDCRVSLTELHYVAIEHAITLAAVQLVKEEAVQQAQQSYYRDLLEDLISGAFKSRELAVSRAESLDLLLNKPQVILVIDIDHFSGYIMQKGIDYESRATELKQHMAHIVNTLVQRFAWRTLVVQRSDSVVVIMPVLRQGGSTLRGTPFHSDLEDLAQTIQKKIMGKYPEITVSIGISSIVEDPLDISAKYQDVRSVIKLNQKVQGEGKIAFWEDFEIYLLLEKLGQPIERFYQVKLGALQNPAVKNRKELLMTLKTYLECQGNSIETAEKLFIHRNTLRYRLQRIEKILGRDLSQSEERFSLWLALKIGTLIEKER
jgi:PucR family transcriptional regulator, purine catabolism regulatory protein